MVIGTLKKSDAVAPLPPPPLVAYMQSVHFVTSSCTKSVHVFPPSCTIRAAICSLPPPTHSIDFLYLLSSFAQSIYSSLSSPAQVVSVASFPSTHCPDITEMVDWVLKNQLPTYLPSTQSVYSSLPPAQNIYFFPSFFTKYQILHFLLHD